MRSRPFLVFAIVIALIASIAAHPMSKDPLPGLPNVHAASRTISLVGNFNAWNFSLASGSNPTITVNQGDIVTISLTSVDTTHQFALDVDKDGAKFTGACSTGDTCSMAFSMSAPTSVMIDTSSLSGTYTYFCTFHGSMVGSFIVVGGIVGASSVPMNSPAMITVYLIVAGLAAMLITSAVVLRTRRTKTNSTL